MAATIHPSENGALLGFTGAKFNRDSVPSLLIAVDSLSGNPYPLARDETSKGLLVQDSAALTLLSTIASATPPSIPTGVRTFQQTLVGAALQIVPLSVNGLGKTITNASSQGGAVGADMWVGPVGVSAGTGHYLSPGSSVSLSGRAAVYAFGTGLVTALEEYV